MSEYAFDSVDELAARLQNLLLLPGTYTATRNTLRAHGEGHAATPRSRPHGGT
jgi:hypothetical protein